MYEENNKSFFNGGLLLLILKLVCLGIFIFLICWLFLRNNQSSVSKDSDGEYIANIGAMKEAAFEYFTKEKLPKTVGKSQKLTLEEMVNQKLLIDFTNNGKTCDLESSYVQATKTADENYALKVTLNCDKKEDYIVTTIEKKEVECTVNCNNNNNNNSTSTQTTTDKKEEEVKPTPTPSTNQSTNQNQVQSTVNKNNTTTNKTTITKKVITKITYNYYTYCDNCSSSPKPEEPKKEVKYYEMVLYGPWQEGKKEGSGYESTCEKVKTYDYCKVNYVNYYANCMIPESYSEKIYQYKLDIPITGSVNPYLDSRDYYTSINDYNTYVNAKKAKPTDIFNLVYPNSTGQGMMNYSLKKGNFSISSVGSSIYNKNLTLTFSINLLNRNGVTPYYSEYLKYRVYFLPIKFTLGYKKPETCIRDFASNASKYPDYRRFPVNDTEVCKHRSVTYKWVKESEVKSYVEQGWQTTGKTKVETI